VNDLTAEVYISTVWRQGSLVRNYFQHVLLALFLFLFLAADHLLDEVGYPFWYPVHTAFLYK